MKALAKIGYLYYSGDVDQVFLRSQGTDIAKIIGGLAKPTTSEILTRFRSTFPQTENHGECVPVISTMQGALKKNIVSLKTQVEQAYALSQARRLLNENR
jgi:hypothetical protein